MDLLGAGQPCPGRSDTGDRMIEAWARLMAERWRAGLPPNLIVEVHHSEMLRILDESRAYLVGSIIGIRGPLRLNFTAGFVEFREEHQDEARAALRAAGRLQ